MTIGIYLAFARLHGFIEVHGVLGGCQGRDVGEEVVFVLLSVFLCVWDACWECESTPTSHLSERRCIDLTILLGDNRTPSSSPAPPSSPTSPASPASPPPTAWIFMQFASCNVASAVLVSSNPTNLVLTGAYEISFLVYSAWLVLPVVATAVVLFPLLLWGVFREEELIPRKLIAPDVEPKTALIDKRGAIFGSVLLGITLVALVTLSAVGLLEGVEGVWTVTAPAALVMVGRDIWHDLHRNVWASSGKLEGTTSPDSGEREDLVEETTEGIEMQGMDDLAGAKGIAENGKANGKMGRGMRRRTVSDLGKAAGGTLSGGSKAGPVTPSTNTSQLALVPSAQPSSAPTPLPPNPLNTNTNTGLTSTSSSNRPRHRTLQSLLKSFSVRFPTFTHIFVRLPLPLLPFAFSMFILVEALGFVGWIRIFGGWWSAWVKVGGVAGAIWLMGVLSVLGCNVGIVREVNVLEKAC